MLIRAPAWGRIRAHLDGDRLYHGACGDRVRDLLVLSTMSPPGALLTMLSAVATSSPFCVMSSALAALSALVCGILLDEVGDEPPMSCHATTDDRWCPLVHPTQSLPMTSLRVCCLSVFTCCCYVTVLLLLLFVFLPTTACEVLDAGRGLQGDRVGHARVRGPLPRVRE